MSILITIPTGSGAGCGVERSYCGPFGFVLRLDPPKSRIEQILLGLPASRGGFGQRGVAPEPDRLALVNNRCAPPPGLRD
jgi:hypothetical protein